MKIELRQIPVRDLFAGFVNDEEEGVFGYGGRLNIRPQYQREFIYEPKQQAAVIDSVRKGFPLNVMYWCENADGTFDLLDGQQRTLSICNYLSGAFFIDWDGTLLGFDNLSEERRNALLDYKLMVYVCRGGTQEKLDWFRTINIAGERLADQEIRNAMFPGAWITDMKRHFSKTMCVAYQLGKNYMTGSCIRQDYLETVLRWKATADGVVDVDAYMGLHQKDPDASAEWQYFQKVIQQTQIWFPKYWSKMKGVQWGLLYNRYRDIPWNTNEKAEMVKRLMADSDVTAKGGVFEYALGGDERKLSIRAFDDNMRLEAWTRQGGVCPRCGKHFEIEQMQADHIKPWSKGGHTVAANCQMLCADCNARKSDKF